jgi:hypothetical protein
MRWLKATRSISVDFGSQDPMNLVTRTFAPQAYIIQHRLTTFVSHLPVCYACSFHWENDIFRFIPSPRNIEAMIMSDAVDQISCQRALAARQPPPPRVWPHVCSPFSVTSLQYKRLIRAAVIASSLVNSKCMQQLPQVTYPFFRICQQIRPRPIGPSHFPLIRTSL